MATGIYDSTADILFRAAINLGQGRKLSVRAAIVQAIMACERRIPPRLDWREVFRTYMQISGYSDDCWHYIKNPRGGFWLSPSDRNEQVMSVLFTYEYLVQECEALRSPIDLDYS
jgi:hypothetical protein